MTSLQQFYETNKVFKFLDYFFNEFQTVYGHQCKGVYSRETTHGLGVPHKQVLAFICLQHELGDADACGGVTVEHDGGVRHFGLLSSTC